MNTVFKRGAVSMILLFVAGLPLSANAAWTQELVDNSRDVGYASQIAFHGDFHIVYFDNTNHVLKYAHQTPGTPWAIENIGGGGHASLALDANGVPHIAFVTGSGNNTTLVHGIRTAPNQWATGIVDQGQGTLIGDTSIAIGPNGAIHVAYRFGSQLKYAVNAPGAPNFTTMLVDGGAPLNKNTGVTPSIAVDPTGRPSIAYGSFTDHALMFAQWNGSKWILDTADSNSNVGSFISLSMANGRPNIAYFGKSGLLYQTWVSGPGDWIRNPTFGEIVDTAGIQLGVSIVLDGAGVPHIAYPANVSPTGGAELRYATRTGANAWVHETADVPGVSAPSLVLDAGGRPHISYASAVPGSQPLFVLKAATVVPTNRIIHDVPKPVFRGN